MAIASRVEFAGPAFGRRKLDLLSHATAFVHTSRWEGLAFAVLKAACLELPLLLTPAADPGGKLGPAGAAIVVPPTTSAIAEGLRRLADLNPRERDEMGRRARRLVEAEFAWPAVARTMTGAYRRYSLFGRRP
ncbi:MAG: glycosyltransferase family 4 protein [Gemmatimonadales bacterium]|nr:glycosyltransferase family 4 protein [Gemmatimonadales bacterium]